MAGRTPLSTLGHAVVISTTMLVGTVTRSVGPLTSEFPLNDGGLFYRMILDLRRTWPFLPATTEYNALQIPFAYPPLGLYVGAAFHDLLGVDALRVLPWLFTCLTVPAVYVLARAISGGVLIPALASSAFAMTPLSFEWLVMGGGITRALGLLLAIVALWLTWRLIDRPSSARAAVAGVAAGMTLLTHPQATLFLLSGGVLFLAARMRTRHELRFVLQAVVVTGMVIAPWIVSVLLQHGVGPLVSAAGSQPGLLTGVYNLLSLDFTGSRVSPVIGTMAVMGLIVSLMRGRWLLPIWFAAVLVLDARGGATYATVPAALLAGEAFAGLVVAPFWRQRPVERVPSRFLRAHPTSSILTAVLLVAALIDAMGSQLAPDWSAVALQGVQREPMAWVATEGPPQAEYLVVTGQPWAEDATAEWFPVLAQARSVATVQGTEWLGTATFNAALEASEDLRRCADQTDACIEAWSDDHAPDYTHVYIPKGTLDGPLGDPDCCVALRQTLRADAHYRTLYDGAGATIFERLPDR